MLFRTRLALEQLQDSIPRREAFVEHAMDGVADRHVDAVMARERAHRGRGGHALGTVPQVPEDLRQRFPRGERQAHAAIARQVAGAGEHEIAQAGEAHQCFTPAAEHRTAQMAVAAVLVVAALSIEGPAVLDKAWKSFGYRVQYWQSSVLMIADHPLVGCGPGNFQNVYTQYKLPDASEEVADPHNFLLDVWATAGTPDSPTPPGASVLGTMCTSIAGISCIRSSG
jgi:hypothetical protein